VATTRCPPAGDLATGPLYPTWLAKLPGQGLEAALVVLFTGEVVPDRWYRSSKTCSRCKAVKTKLWLSERTHRCEHCDLVIDRDLNAATNLASLVEPVKSIGTASGGPARARPWQTYREKRGPWARPGAPRRAASATASLTPRTHLGMVS
jgi:hypothetical protein